MTNDDLEPNESGATNQFDLDYSIGLDPKEAATKFMMCLFVTIYVPYFDYLLPIYWLFIALF